MDDLKNKVICKECSQQKWRCICDKNVYAKKYYIEMYKAQDFLRYISNNESKREPVGISISFEHKTFKENTGFARFFGDSEFISEIVLAIEKETQNQIKEIKKKIDDFERI